MSGIGPVIRFEESDRKVMLDHIPRVDGILFDKRLPFALNDVNLEKWPISDGRLPSRESPVKEIADTKAFFLHPSVKQVMPLKVHQFGRVASFGSSAGVVQGSSE